MNDNLIILLNNNKCFFLCNYVKKISVDSISIKRFKKKKKLASHLNIVQLQQLLILTLRNLSEPRHRKMFFFFFKIQSVLIPPRATLHASRTWYHSTKVTIQIRDSKNFALQKISRFARRISSQTCVTKKGSPHRSGRFASPRLTF